MPNKEWINKHTTLYVRDGPTGKITWATTGEVVHQLQKLPANYLTSAVIELMTELPLGSLEDIQRQIKEWIGDQAVPF